MLILLRFELVAIRILGILELGQVISRGVLAQQILDIGLEFESAHLDKLIAVWGFLDIGCGVGTSNPLLSIDAFQYSIRMQSYHLM